MGLRLVGVDYPGIEGLDELGWLKAIIRACSDPALTITQNGAGASLSLPGAITATKGLVLGGDVALYRSAADVLALADHLDLLTNELRNAKAISPTIQGVVGAGTGLTMPAFTMGGAFDLAGNALRDNTGNSYLAIRSYRAAASPGVAIQLETLNAADAVTARLGVTGGVATAVATWTAVTHTGLQVTSGGNIAGAGTGANGWVAKDLKNSANTGVSGTAKTVEIDIGGTPYYFLVYPTSSA